MKLLLFFALALFNPFACGEGGKPAAANTELSANSRNEPSDTGRKASSETNTAEPQTGPRSIRDFFTLLPEKYFTLEGCDRGTDKECKKARAEYLKSFTEVEDTANGYFKGGCDGAQSCIEMTIFKRPDDSYLVGLATFSEMMNEFHFLDYASGKWNDVSAGTIPDFDKRNWYELPRFGTTMKVYRKKIIEKSNEFEITEKGGYLYSLEWKNGKFTRK